MLKDPKFCAIEGFPIGLDKDILALSDPPYYTACPNPFLGEFIAEHGTPYDEATDDYHREPFAADVSEGRMAAGTRGAATQDEARRALSTRTVCCGCIRG